MKSREGREALKRNKTKMAVACASRYAVLKIEDDDEPAAVKKQLRANAKQITAHNVEKKKAKKKKAVDEKDCIAAELQNLAFVTNNKSKKKPNLTSRVSVMNKKEGTPSPEQWEEWKKKDNEFVNDSYEQDLKQALLLSRLEFEEKKELYTSKSPEKNDKNTKKSKEKKSAKKKEKSSTLSLGEFNNLLPSQIETLSSKDAKLEIIIETPPSTQPPLEPAEDIWTDVAADIKTIIQKEKSRKPMPNQALTARSLQFQDEIEKREKENEILTQELELLKAELQTVKVRNKKLCNILGQGEMREKAEILVQVDQLTRVKDELTQEVFELHAALEQERSKVHGLQTELKKCQAGRKESK